MERLLRKLNDENAQLRQLVSSAEHGWREALLVCSTLKSAAIQHHKYLLHHPEENVETLQGTMRLKALENEVGLYQRRFNNFMHKEQEYQAEIMKRIRDLRLLVGAPDFASLQLRSTRDMNTTFDAGDVESLRSHSLAALDDSILICRDILTRGMFRNKEDVDFVECGDEQLVEGSSEIADDILNPEEEAMAMPTPPSYPEPNLHHETFAAQMTDIGTDYIPGNLMAPGIPPVEVDLDETLSEDGVRHVHDTRRMTNHADRGPITTSPRDICEPSSAGRSQYHGDNVDGKREGEDGNNNEDARDGKAADDTEQKYCEGNHEGSHSNETETVEVSNSNSNHIDHDNVTVETVAQKAKKGFLPDGVEELFDKVAKVQAGEILPDDDTMTQKRDTELKKSSSNLTTKATGGKRAPVRRAPSSSSASSKLNARQGPVGSKVRPETVKPKPTLTKKKVLGSTSRASTIPSSTAKPSVKPSVKRTATTTKSRKPPDATVKSKTSVRK